MYSLVKISDSSDELVCLALKIILGIMIIFWLCHNCMRYGRKRRSRREYFNTHNFKGRQYEDKLNFNELVPNLYSAITANCKPENCLNNVWNPYNTSATGSSVGNFSTSRGCCKIPSNLGDYIYAANGNNAVRMSPANESLKMDSNLKPQQLSNMNNYSYANVGPRVQSTNVINAPVGAPSVASVPATVPVPVKPK